MKKIITILLRFHILSLVFVTLAKLKKRADSFKSYTHYRLNFPYAGENILHHSVEIKYPENIKMGEKIIIGPNVTLGGKGVISIGDYVRVSKGVVIETAGLDINSGLPYQHIAQQISINNGVWLGTNAIILGGVTIGEHSVIGAGSVISKDVPSNVIVVGNGKIVGTVN